MTEIINLRGHHLISIENCISNLNYVGLAHKILYDKERVRRYVENHCLNMADIAGYSKMHGSNLSKIILDILIEKDVKVKLTNTLDDICKECNKKKVEGCDKPHSPQYNRNREEDNREIKFYGLKLGKVYTSKHIFKKIKKSAIIFLRKFEERQRRY